MIDNMTNHEPLHFQINLKLINKDITSTKAHIKAMSCSNYFIYDLAQFPVI
jgi:hypothetical protein